MSQTTGWSPGGPGMQCADSIADRMLKALEMDYLDTLQADRKQPNISPEQALKLPQGQSSGGDISTEVFNEDAEASSALKEATAGASESTSADHPVQIPGKKKQRAELLLKHRCEPREKEDSDSNSEPDAEFAYERLPSSEELLSPHSVSDEDAESAQRSSTRSCSSRNTCSLERLPEPSGDQCVEASGTVVCASLAATDHPAGSPRDPESHALPEAEPIPEGEEHRKLTAPDEVEDPHRLASEGGDDPLAEQRPVLRGDMPLDEQSAAFISEIMRGLSLQNPRRDVQAEPTA